MNPTRSHRWLVTAALVTMLALLAPTAALPDSGPDTFKAWQKRWTQMLTAMSRAKPEKHITYDRHRKPRRGSVVTLPKPVPTHQDIDVEVEWFFTYLSDSQNGGRISYLFDQWITFWAKNLRQHGLDNVRLIRTPVSHIKGLEGNWGDHRERHLEVALAFGGPDQAPGDVIHGYLLRYLADGTKALSLRTRAEAERFVTTHGVLGYTDLPERYQAAAGTPELTARMQANNDRLARVLEQAAKINPSTTLSPHDPIFLVNGRHLVTGSNARRNNPVAVFQTVNKLIADELGDRWTRRDAQRAQARTKDLKNIWSIRNLDQTNRARLRRAIILDPPIPTRPDATTVELFYSYDTAATHTLTNHALGWLDTLPDPIVAIDSPVGIHQAIIMAGRPVVWEETIEVNLRGRVRKLQGARHIRTEADLNDFLADINMPRADYNTGRNHPDTKARLKGVNERYARIRAAAGDMKHADPVILINGRYLIVGHRFRRVIDAFQTANALITQELDAAQ